MIATSSSYRLVPMSKTNHENDGKAVQLQRTGALIGYCAVI